MKKMFTVVYLLAMVVGFFNIANAGQDFNYFVFKVNKANIRAEPNTKSKIVGSARIGSYIKFPTYHVKGDWIPYKAVGVKKVWFEYRKKLYEKGYLEEDIKYPGFICHDRSDIDTCYSADIIQATGNEPKESNKDGMIWIEVFIKDNNPTDVKNYIVFSWIYKSIGKIFENSGDAEKYSNQILEKKSQLDKDRKERSRKAKLLKLQREGCSLAINTWKWYKDYDWVIAEGMVTNLTDKPIKSINVVLTVYTDDGTYITYSDSFIKYLPLLPGQSSPFRTSTTWNPMMKKANITFKHFAGPIINSCQLK